MRNKKQNKIISIFTVTSLFILGLFYKFDVQNKTEKIAEAKTSFANSSTDSQKISSHDICDTKEEDSNEFLFVGCNGIF